MYAIFDKENPDKVYFLDENRETLAFTISADDRFDDADIVEVSDSEIERGFDGALYRKGYAPVQQIEEAKSAKLSEINSACDAILNQAVNSYPESEVLTFDQQVEEVKAYQSSGNTADAPLLSALASARGITLDDLIQRVLSKRQAFSVLSGYVIGQRQALEDRLDECQTTEDVNAIVVDIKIPEAD